GYVFADLHASERLESIYHRFVEEVQSADPKLWREWDEYRRDPDAPRSPLEISDLLVRMSRHVSAFVTRLFNVGEAAAEIAQSTRAQDVLFRFKGASVRRRVLPFLKGAAHVASSADDDAMVEAMIAGSNAADRELAIARAGCALLDAEKQAPGTSTRGTSTGGTRAGGTSTQHRAPSTGHLVEALKHWCAARLHDPAYRSWVTFRFP